MDEEEEQEQTWMKGNRKRWSHISMRVREYATQETTRENIE
jgi:hypothetical protein